MRKLLVLALVLGLAGVAVAADLGNQALPKATPVVPENIPNPVRQGGDTIANATLIPSLPYNDSGTTSGYTNDYDEVCPYTGSTSPDVVYRYVSPGPGTVAFDLYGSAYDTKMYVYDNAGNLVACNDDYYSDYTSFVTGCLVAGTYYIVVDGYAGAFGAYTFAAYVSDCAVTCPAGAVIEGEPTIVDGYVDNYNGGCNTPPANPFQDLTEAGDATGEFALCGKGGWYITSTGGNSRDTDWITLRAGETGIIEVTGDAEQATYIFELGPQNCTDVAVVQNAIIGPCLEGYLTIGGYAPGAPVWFWVGSNSYTQVGCTNEYDYVIWFVGVYPVAAENQTWGGVKALFE